MVAGLSTTRSMRYLPKLKMLQAHLVKDGGILMSIHADDSTWTKKGKLVLEQCNAKDVSSTGEAGFAAQFSKTNPQCIAHKLYEYN